jgi:hypothetical protein
MSRITALLACAMLPAVFLVGAVGPAQATDRPGRDLDCDGRFVGRTFNDVAINSGDRCVIVNSTITGNVASNGGVRVRLINTDVAGSVRITEILRSVRIGSRDCRVDPSIGGDLEVNSSNNVAICEMTVGGSMLLGGGNLGRMMVRDNTVCQGILIANNDLRALRVLSNVHVGNLVTRRNQVLVRRSVEGNRQVDDPAACSTL